MQDGQPVPIGGKDAFMQQYKFSIAGEHIQRPGYVTEKIADAFRAGCIPIYVGDPLLLEEWNSESMVFWNGENDTLNEVISRIKEIDNDDVLYREMLMKNKFNSENYLGEITDLFENFLIMIADNRDVLQRMPVYKPKEYEDSIRSMSNK